MTHERNTVVYIGMTNDLLRRVLEHREGRITGFTQKYRLKKLVFFEFGSDAYGAITQEKECTYRITKSGMEGFICGYPGMRCLLTST